MGGSANLNQMNPVQAYQFFNQSQFSGQFSGGNSGDNPGVRTAATEIEQIQQEEQTNPEEAQNQLQQLNNQIDTLDPQDQSNFMNALTQDVDSEQSVSSGLSSMTGVSLPGGPPQGSSSGDPTGTTESGTDPSVCTLA